MICIHGYALWSPKFYIRYIHTYSIGILNVLMYINYSVYYAAITKDNQYGDGVSIGCCKAFVVM